MISSLVIGVACLCALNFPNFSFAGQASGQAFHPKTISSLINYSDWMDLVQWRVTNDPLMKRFWVNLADQGSSEARGVSLFGGMVRGLLVDTERLLLSGKTPNQIKAMRISGVNKTMLQEADIDLLDASNFSNLQSVIDRSFPEGFRNWDIIDQVFYEESLRSKGPALDKLAINPWSVTDPMGALKAFWQGQIVFEPMTDGREEGLKLVLRHLRQMTEMPNKTMSQESLIALQEAAGIGGFKIDPGYREDMALLYGTEKALKKLLAATNFDFLQTLKILRKYQVLDSLKEGPFQLALYKSDKTRLDSSEISRLASELIEAGFSAAELLNVRRILQFSTYSEWVAYQNVILNSESLRGHARLFFEYSPGIEDLSFLMRFYRDLILDPTVFSDSPNRAQLRELALENTRDLLAMCRSHFADYPFFRPPNLTAAMADQIDLTQAGEAMARLSHLVKDVVELKSLAAGSNAEWQKKILDELVASGGRLPKQTSLAMVQLLSKLGPVDPSIPISQILDELHGLNDSLKKQLDKLARESLLASDGSIWSARVDEVLAKLTDLKTPGGVEDLDSDKLIKEFFNLNTRPDVKEAQSRLHIALDQLIDREPMDYKKIGQILRLVRTNKVPEPIVRKLHKKVEPYIVMFSWDNFTPLNEFVRSFLTLGYSQENRLAADLLLTYIYSRLDTRDLTLHQNVFDVFYEVIARQKDPQWLARAQSLVQREIDDKGVDADWSGLIGRWLVFLSGETRPITLKVELSDWLRAYHAHQKEYWSVMALKTLAPLTLPTTKGNRRPLTYTEIQTLKSDTKVRQFLSNSGITITSLEKEASLARREAMERNRTLKSCADLLL